MYISNILYNIRLEIFVDIITTTVRSGAQQHLQEESLDIAYTVLEVKLFSLTYIVHEF